MFYNENKDLRNYSSIPQVFKSLNEYGSITQNKIGKIFQK